jgi:O-antigen/teichoic acid export membrane protein
MRVGGMPWGRRLAGDFIVYGLGGSVAKVINAFLLPVFTRILTPGDLGIIDLLTSVASIVMVVGGLGIESALMYFYARSQDARERRKIASTALLFALVGTLVASSVALVVEPLFRTIVGSASYSQAFVLTLVLVPVTLSAGIVMDILRLEFRRRAYAVVSFGRAVGTALLAIAIVVTTGTGVAGYMLSLILVNLISIAACLWLVRRLVGASPQITILRRLLGYGLPLVPLGITAWILTWGDRVFLAAYGYVGDLGYYAVANRLAQLTFLAVLAVQVAWAPFAITASLDPAHRPAFATVFRIVAFGLLALVAITSLVAGPLVELALPVEYGASIPVVPFLAAAVAVQGMGGLVAIGLLLTERTGRLAMIGGLAAASNVLFNIIAIPTLGILGAGIATFVASAFSFVLIYLAAERVYPIGYPGGRFIVASLAIGISIVISVSPYLLRQGIGAPVVPLAIRVLGVATLTAVAGFVLGVHPFVVSACRAMAGTVSHPRIP